MNEYIERLLNLTEELGSLQVRKYKLQAPPYNNRVTVGFKDICWVSGNVLMMGSNTEGTGETLEIACKECLNKLQGKTIIKNGNSDKRYIVL